MSPLLGAALAFLLFGFLCVRAALEGWRVRRRALGVIVLLVGLVLLLQGTAAALILVGTRGYRALTQETLAATVTTESLGPRSFRAEFRYPDGVRQAVTLSGDELYVDAHILKWRPFVNVLGLHTQFELDRVSGRYASLDDEREAPRTVYALGLEKPFDFFHLARGIPLFRPLVDAEYGSASFVPAEDGATFELRISTSGLLFRRAE